MRQKPFPTARQEEWANMEVGVLIHHCMDVYHPNKPHGFYKASTDQMPAESFAPTDENTDQWIETAAKMGAKYAVLVAKHVTGFCLWPTKEYDYSIANSPYQNGKADIVLDFVKSCKKYGLKPGLYYSTDCNGYLGLNNEKPIDYSSEKYQEYARLVERQLTELWNNYGELFEIWFDGGVIPHDKGGADIVSLLKKYQPNAVCFQGPTEHHQNLRWVGNERGVAPKDCWSTSFDKTSSCDGMVERNAIGIGSPDGDIWIPAETDMGNRRPESSTGGWGWVEDEEHLVYSPEELLERYLTSVGRNSVLLLGMCISKRGHFEDVEQFEKFGELIRDLYRDPAASCRGLGKEFMLELEQPEYIRHLVIMEDIHYGENVRKFHIELETEDGMETFFNAQCIGHKRIIPLHKTIKKACLIIDESADTPIIKEMTLYR